ncbi:nicotinamide N-methyltransferase-like [Pelodytes ibericus]
MDSSLHKFYHVHGFDPKHFTNTYFSPNVDEGLHEEAVIDSMKYMHEEAISGVAVQLQLMVLNAHPIVLQGHLASGMSFLVSLSQVMTAASSSRWFGNFKGDRLIDVSLGPVISHLLPFCEQFKEITILECDDRCIKDLEKWKNNHLDSSDWAHVSKAMMDLHGECNVWQEKEEALRRKVKLVLKCDFDKENLTDPITLPKADCIISTWLLGCISKDHAAYCSNLKKISSMLKPGGRLILFGDINMSYYVVGQEKFHYLTYDEEFLRASLNAERFKIERYETHDRKTTSDITDNDKVVRLTAVKEVEI